MTMSDERESAYKQIHEFDLAHPVGTPVLAWPGTRDQKPLRTRTRSSAWVLPAGDPVVLVAGHSAGIALTHVELDPTRQPAVPDIEFVAPDCPICGNELHADADGFSCEDCDAHWGRDGRHGAWEDPRAARCPATRSWSRDGIPDDQCTLAAGHDGGIHYTRDGISGWNDSYQHAVIDSDGERIGGDR